MAGLLYYLPGAGPLATRLEYENAGIGYALDEERLPVARGVHGGPDGNNGLVVADSAGLSADKVLYLREEQTWSHIPGSTVWLGRYRDEVCKPEELRRRKILAGHGVTLADGQSWTIPVARAHAEVDGRIVWDCALPERLGLDDDGNWIRGAVHEKHRRLWEVATAWWDACFGSTDVEQDDGGVSVSFDFAGSADAALIALQANYRLGRAEVAMLGLFDNQTVQSILMATIDWPTLQAISKKKAAGISAPGDSLIDAGSPGSIETTDRASQT